MKKTVFREHGTHTDIEHGDTLVPRDPASWAGESVDEADDHGTTIHTRRYDRSERAADRSFTLGRLRHIYADAIEYTGAMRKRDGASLLFALFVFFAMSFILVGMAFFLWEPSHGSRTSYLGFFFLCGLVPQTVWMIFDGLRFPWEDLFFTLEDTPIIFDRKHRKVYRLLPHEGTGLWNAILRRPLVACEYDWDLVDVACDTRKGYLYEPKRHSTLRFSVRYSRTWGVPIASFELDVHELEGDHLDPMWEHIRRFMEEDGRALPDPAEGLACRAAPESWWTCLRMTGPDAPLFLCGWRTAPVSSLASLLLSPVSLPIRLVWGTTNYLVRQTEFLVQWPALVQERLGSPLPAPAPVVRAVSTPSAGRRRRKK